MKVQELEKRIEKMQSRRPSLLAEVAQAAITLAEARSALVDGTAAADAVTTADARHNAMAAALVDLDSQVEQAGRDLIEARLVVQREQRFMHIAELATYATRRTAEREKLLRETERKLAPLLDDIVQAAQDLMQARHAFTLEARQLAPGVLSLKSGQDADGSLQRGVDAMMGELRARGVDLSELLINRGPAYSATVIDANPRPIPESERTPASRAVSAAVNAYSRKPENN